MSPTLFSRVKLASIAGAAVAGYLGWVLARGSCPMCSLAEAVVGARARGGDDRGGAAPLFTAASLDGRRVSLEEYRGKVVLLDFWATWCGPCVGEIPSVKAAYDRHHAAGLEIIGISLDRDRATLQAFIDRMGMSWPQVFNADAAPGQDPASLYGVQAIPHTVLLGRDGSIIATGLRGDALTESIQAAVR